LPAKRKGRFSKAVRRIGRILAMAILLAGAVIILIPLVWTVCMALKPAGEIYSGRFFPAQLAWGNFAQAITSIPFFLYLWNTLKIVIPNVIGMVFTCSLVAYGFSRIFKSL
jgi:multiple sugar transport system permease protein